MVFVETVEESSKALLVYAASWEDQRPYLRRSEGGQGVDTHLSIDLCSLSWLLRLVGALSCRRVVLAQRARASRSVASGGELDSWKGGGFTAFLVVL